MIITFLILTYNHEHYILQNLESIKYQIVNFGQAYDFQLIVADDASKDKTVDLVKHWISLNNELFAYTDISANSINQGTCKNLTNGIRLMKGDYIKLIAGDDLFAAENIFSFINLLEEYDLVMGLHLPFTNEEIDYNGMTSKMIMYCMAEELYCENESFNKRIRRTAFLHAPSVFFNKWVILNENIMKFINEFRVIEDHSMWLKMAAVNNNIKYKFVTKIAVLYRRTVGSTYIIKQNDFYNDRIRLFKYAIKEDRNFLTKIIQYNEMFCFKSENSIVKRYFNFGNYRAKLAQYLWRKEIRRMLDDLESDIELNREYLKKIVNCANDILIAK